MQFTYPATTSVLPSLRRGGVKVRIRHERYVEYILDGNAPAGSNARLEPYARRYDKRAPGCPGPLPCGGKTTVDLVFPDGGSYTGTALCSLSDRFCRRTGIAIALERALAARKEHVRYGVGDTQSPPPNQATREAFVRYKQMCTTQPIPYHPVPSAAIHPR